MSIHQFSFYSNFLKTQATGIVILPEYKVDGLVRIPKPTDRLKVLWLLHGLEDSNQSFIQNSAIGRYANDNQIAIVLPNMVRSFYTDMVRGPKYWSFLISEFKNRLQFFYPLSTKASENYVAGVSMGGFGALKWLLTTPNQFAGVGLLSPVVDVQTFYEENAQLLPDFDLIFDKNNYPDFYQKLRRVKLAKNQKLYHSIGDTDFLKNQNDRMAEFLSNHVRCQYQYHIYKGGHDWQSWDVELQRMLQWLIE